MSKPNFHPSVSTDVDLKKCQDKLLLLFTSWSKNILVVAFGLLPIFFVPLVYAPFAFTKTMMIVVAVVVSILFFSFSVLRSGTLRLHLPLIVLTFWGVALVGLVSALFSGDLADSLLGDTLSVQSAMFICLLAIVLSIVGVFKGDKASLLRFYFLLIISSIVLLIFHLTRFFLGTSFLDLNIFGGTTSSLLGDWNDLAMFFGLITIMIMMALEQLSLNRVSQFCIAILLFFSLVMLMVVNYSAIWIILGIVSFVQLLYSLTKGKFSGGEQISLLDNDSSSNILPVLSTIAIFVTSLSFIIAGSMIGGFINNFTDISYVEVRPSLAATLDITRSVYEDHGILGIGTNKFADAWRLYKDTQINETVFWNVSFVSGSGFIPTTLATSGVLMAGAWLLFFLSFIYSAFRIIFTNRNVDRVWYFLGTTSLVASTYLWILCFVYNPATVMMLLTAFCTGLFMVSYLEIVPSRVFGFSFGNNRSLGVFMIGLVTIIIVVSMSSLYELSKHYASFFSVNRSVNSANIEQLEDVVVQAYQRTSNDIFARELAYYKLVQLNSLLQLEDPSEEEIVKFQQHASDGIQAAQAAATIDPTEPSNQVRLGEIYSSLAVAGVEGSGERAIAAFNAALQHDPYNPRLYFIKAQHFARIGNSELARQFAGEAVQLKSNYTEALTFLAQLDIVEGKTVDAIKRVEAIVTFEPNNPARYYQLGMLLIANNNLERAKSVFSRAISLDTDYANARYYLALVHLEQGDSEAALEQLLIVSQLNPDNETLKQLIESIKNGEVEQIPNSGNDVVTPSASDDDRGVTVEKETETNLVTPINVVPSSNDE